ncbi:putative SAM-dependent methyltransferase [Sulfurimonas gotlandica GD1]|uniref:Putative SAM-dependent methyltransferase n=1 Tax=Sulfurimonas gotlandica (strain DSM 19862 / JCM 16533 / GD1) TaxID=929558 RepID=B6BNY3_SULGG|nr:class I SAM-dependent rRNA methyltransferase [Sulfurimonas gotlandica]EDZ61289.1 methyltransferase [Sulfurimonas gotlandica GD1]EHP28939.1 putative SAM-dependent methyltransferase [Sulfurimonas gotlandica GD1]
MNKEINLSVKEEFVSNYKNGYPLISKESIVDWTKVSQEGTIVKLTDPKNNFIAKGYYGIQNKGYGWVLTAKEDEKIDADYFAKKIKTAVEYREDFYSDEETTAFRVFNGEGDGVGGLTIDYFDGFYMITWYSIGIYELKVAILDALKSSVNYRGIYQKKRFDGKGKYLDDADDFVCGERADAPIIVKENGANFAIYLDDGAMVGVFLDQKDVRKTIRDKYAKGKTVLNTFSYTGAFSIFAALGGAKKTTSVDLAKRSLPKTREQFSVNNIDADKQEIIVEDVFNYFKFAVRKKLLFDMVVLDPPSFARSKKHTFSASKDYVNLLKEAIQITNKGGVIVASTNSANFSMMTFSDFVKRAFKELNGRYKVEQTFSLPKDFRVHNKFQEGNYLKVMFIRKIG